MKQECLRQGGLIGQYQGALIWMTSLGLIIPLNWIVKEKMVTFFDPDSDRFHISPPPPNPALT